MLSENLINEIDIIKLNERIDTFTAPQLRQHFTEKLGQGFTNFIVDLSGVTFLDSAGLAALVQLYKRSREAGGDVKVILPQNENVLRIFRLTKFDQVFEIHPNIESATLSF